MKRLWARPKLTVLARRSNPEDVLTTCKGVVSGDPGSIHEICVGLNGECENCFSIGGS